MEDDLIAELEKALLGFLKGEHSCLYLSFHDENGQNYKSVSELVAEYSKDRSWVSEDEKQKAIDLNRMWTFHWYSETPIEFHSISASSLSALFGHILKQ
jgi:hypothetical protein